MISTKFSYFWMGTEREFIVWFGGGPFIKARYHDGRLHAHATHAIGDFPDPDRYSRLPSPHAAAFRVPGPLPGR
ncbi:hypothetical protein DESC_700019 [Desulfosarcina cetonica]|nr:hypothetical protein DESC_700019 [Desulfosarcina cetonica]